jgi:pilus assembly protein Flp/PilA
MRQRRVTAWGDVSEAMMTEQLLNVVARLQAEEGQTMVEYGLILALVSVVAITILGTMGTNVITTFTSAANAL